MNVKRGAQGFSTLLGLTKATRSHFRLRPICAEKREVLIIVGHFMFLVSMADHQRAATRRIIKISHLDETICTALRRMRDEPCIGRMPRSHLSNTASHRSRLPCAKELLITGRLFAILHALFNI